jgi:hypothetical protein
MQIIFSVSCTQTVFCLNRTVYMGSMCVRARVCVCVCNTYFFIWIYKGFVPTLQKLIYIPVLQQAVSLLYVISLIGSVRSVTYRSGFFVKKWMDIQC